jgi:hypothetical protein
MPYTTAVGRGSGGLGRRDLRADLLRFGREGHLPFFVAEAYMVDAGEPADLTDDGVGLFLVGAQLDRGWRG